MTRVIKISAVCNGVLVVSVWWAHTVPCGYIVAVNGIAVVVVEGVALLLTKIWFFLPYSTLFRCWCLVFSHCTFRIDSITSDFGTFFARACFRNPFAFHGISSTRMRTNARLLRLFILANICVNKLNIRMKIYPAHHIMLHVHLYACHITTISKKWQWTRDPLWQRSLVYPVYTKRRVSPLEQIHSRRRTPPKHYDNFACFGILSAATCKQGKNQICSRAHMSRRCVFRQFFFSHVHFSCFY